MALQRTGASNDLGVAAIDLQGNSKGRPIGVMTGAKSFSSDIKDLVFESLALTHDGNGVFDVGDVLVYCNDNMAAMFSLPLETAIGLSFDDLIRHNFETGSGLPIEAESLEQWLESAHRMRPSKTFRSFEVDRVDNRWFLITEHTEEDDTLLIFAPKSPVRKHTKAGFSNSIRR